MEVIIHPDRESANRAAAEFVAQAVRRNPRIVLGLATGETPLGLYENLAAMNKRGEISFAKVTSFNLDEYYGIGGDDVNSYAHYMRVNFFDKIDIDLANTHIPDGTAANPAFACADYERAIKNAGGVELQILGIGGDGHIGFNEPTSSLSSRTRMKTLTRETIRDNARFFGGDPEKVPHHVLTMGIGTIMDAETVVMLAFGAGKADAVAGMVEGAITSMVPASVLQMHGNAKVFLDEAAASKLKLADYYKWVYSRKPADNL